jgi:putative tryptophan/tyrosine transport system substrate-binding protein
MRALRSIRPVVVAIGLLATALTPEAQPGGKIHRIGWLTPSAPPPPGTPSSDIDAFKDGLRALGYVEGQHFTLEARFGDARFDRLPALAAELIARKVDVLVVVGTPTVRAAKEATTTIPIVMAGSADPVEHGFVASLARPGGNVTVVTHSPGPEIAGKGLELLKEAAPEIARVAVLWDSSGIHEGPSVKVQEEAARKLGITLLPHDAKTLEELTTALTAITRERADALFGFPNFVNGKHEDRILGFAAARRLPTMFQSDDAVEAGGLMSYYTNWLNLRRRSATYVDRILKGTKPGDTPDWPRGGGRRSPSRDRAARRTRWGPSAGHRSPSPALGAP